MAKTQSVAIPMAAVQAISRFQRVLRETLGLELSQTNVAGLLIKLGAQAKISVVETPAASITFPSVVELELAGAKRVGPPPTSSADPPTSPPRRGKRELRTAECACGCGGTFQTKNPDRRWLPGHNPKHGPRVSGGHVVPEKPQRQAMLRSPQIRTKNVNISPEKKASSPPRPLRKRRDVLEDERDCDLLDREETKRKRDEEPELETAGENSPRHRSRLQEIQERARRRALAKKGIITVGGM